MNRLKWGILLLPVMMLIGVGLGLYWWRSTRQPASIPYERWDVYHLPNAALKLSESGEDKVPLENDDLLEAKDFVFSMGVGSGMVSKDSAWNAATDLWPSTASR